MAYTFNHISSVSVNSPTSSVTFSSIPQNYTDLCIIISARSSRSSNNDSIAIEPNGSISNRAGVAIHGNSNTATGVITTTEVAFAALIGSNAVANAFSNVEIYVPNYTSSQPKMFRSNGVTENISGSADAAFQSLNNFYWNDTAAITSIVLKSSTGNNFVQYSEFNLYGISNA